MHGNELEMHPGFPAFEALARRIQDEKLLTPLWPDGQAVAVLDQTRLPFQRRVIPIHSAEEMAQAIQRMQIRGSGAIGCAGAFGAYLAVLSAPRQPDRWAGLASTLREARPTAIALQLAVSEVLDAASQAADPVDGAAIAAVAFFERQIEMELAIGRHGAAIIPDGSTLLTHCPSGAFAVAR